MNEQDLVIFFTAMAVAGCSKAAIGTSPEHVAKLSINIAVITLAELKKTGLLNGYFNKPENTNPGTNHQTAGVDVNG